MRVAFFDNGNLSILFSLISNFLNRKGIKSYIITLSKRKKVFLEKKFGAQNVLYLDVFSADPLEGKKFLLNIEKKINEFRLYKAIYMDRVLRYKNELEVKKYLYRYALAIDNFIQENDVSIIFGEVTWAIEYIAYFIMLYRNKKYFIPMNSYVIPDKFAFLDYRNTKSFIKKKPMSIDYEKARIVYLQRMRVDINKKTKFLQTYIPPSFRDRFSILINSWNMEDYRYSLKLKLKILNQYKNRFVINKLSNKLFLTMSDLKKTKKYAIYPLHIQPEATPDVVSTEYNDQLRLIEVIRNSLPSDILLLVKEHPNGIGCRNISTLKRIKSIPGVELIHPKIPMIDLFPYVSITFTIAGTVSFESSINKIPSIIFSDVYYDVFPLVKKEFSYRKLANTIVEQLGLYSRVDFQSEIEDRNIEAIAKINANTFAGKIYDPLLDKNILSKENLKNLKDSFYRFVRYEC